MILARCTNSVKWWFHGGACACWRCFSGTVIESLSVSEDILSYSTFTDQELTQPRIQGGQGGWSMCKKESAQDRKGSRHWKKEKVDKLLEGNLFIPIFFCSKHVGYFQKYTAYCYNKKSPKSCRCNNFKTLKIFTTDSILNRQVSSAKPAFANHTKKKTTHAGMSEALPLPPSWLYNSGLSMLPAQFFFWARLKLWTSSRVAES